MSNITNFAQALAKTGSRTNGSERLFPSEKNVSPFLPEKPKNFNSLFDGEKIKKKRITLSKLETLRQELSEIQKKQPRNINNENQTFNKINADDIGNEGTGKKGFLENLTSKLKKPSESETWEEQISGRQSNGFRFKKDATSQILENQQNPDKNQTTGAG